MKNSLEHYLDFNIHLTALCAIRTRCRCVDAMYGTKDKRVRGTLRKICK